MLQYLVDFFALNYDKMLLQNMRNHRKQKVEINETMNNTEMPKGRITY